MLKSFIFLSLISLVVGCGKFDYSEKPQSVQVKVVSKSRYGFEEIKSQILEPKCMNCHDRHGAYESYTVVKASMQSIYERLVTKDIKRVMPPKSFPQLTSAEMIMLKQWIAAGAPEFKEQEVEPAPQRKIGFLEITNTLLKPYNCVACHSEYNDYGAVRRAAANIASFVASDKMPFPRRRFQNVEFVSKETKDLLFEWVSQGAPEFEDRPLAPLKKVELKPNWISLRNNILGPKCILCHNSFGPRGGKSKTFESYTKLRNWFLRDPELFEFNESSDKHGAFLDSMIDSPSNYYFMPVNYSGDELETYIPPMTEEELNVIKKWIKLQLPYSESDS